MYVETSFRFVQNMFFIEHKTQNKTKKTKNKGFINQINQKTLFITNKSISNQSLFVIIFFFIYLFIYLYIDLYVINIYRSPHSMQYISIIGNRHIHSIQLCIIVNQDIHHDIQHIQHQHMMMMIMIINMKWKKRRRKRNIQHYHPMHLNSNILCIKMKIYGMCMAWFVVIRTPKTTEW